MKKRNLILFVFLIIIIVYAIKSTNMNDYYLYTEWNQTDSPVLQPTWTGQEWVKGAVGGNISVVNNMLNLTHVTGSSWVRTNITNLGWIITSGNVTVEKVVKCSGTTATNGIRLNYEDTSGNLIIGTHYSVTNIIQLSPEGSNIRIVNQSNDFHTIKLNINVDDNQVSVWVNNTKIVENAGTANFNFGWIRYYVDDGAGECYLDNLSIWNGTKYGVDYPPLADTTPPIISNFVCQSCLDTIQNKTSDTTPTINATTDEAATCNISTNNITYVGCSTTGGTTHICAVPDAQAFSIGYPKYVYLNCTDSSSNSRYASIALNITDGQSPTVSLTNNQFDFMYVNRPFTLNFTAFDNYDTSLNCNFYLNNTLNQTNNAVVNGTLTTWTAINISRGYWRYNITCDDDYENHGGNITNFWVNSTAPIFSHALQNFKQPHSLNITIDINATDVDGDILTWYDNTTLFDINQSGQIFDNPNVSDTGDNSIKITIYDGYINVSDTFWYNITDTTPVWDTPIPDNTSQEDFIIFTHVSDLDTLTSDVEDDSLSYNVEYENASKTDCIISGTQLNLSSGANFSGLTNCTISVYDGYYYVNDTFIINVTAVNDAPYFNPNLINQTVNFGVAFSYDINCSDVDNTSLNYYDNTTIFDINFNTGIISFVPNATISGLTSYNITCGDGEFNTSQIFYLNTTGTLLLLDGIDDNRDYEFNTTSQINCTNTSNPSQTFNINIMNAEGNNNTQFSGNNLNFSIKVLRQPKFNDSTTAKNLSNSGNVYLNLDNRTDIVLAQKNMTGFISSNKYPENITIDLNNDNIIDIGLLGSLNNTDLTQSVFIFNKIKYYAINLTYSRAGSKTIISNLSNFHDKFKNITFFLTGFNINEEPFSQNDYFINKTNITSITNLGIYSNYDNFSDNETANGGIRQKWTEQTENSPCLSSIITNSYYYLSCANSEISNYIVSVLNIKNYSRIFWNVTYSQTVVGTCAGSGQGAFRVRLYDGSNNVNLYDEPLGSCTTNTKSAEFELIKRTSDTNWELKKDGSQVYLGTPTLTTTDNWRLGIGGQGAGNEYRTNTFETKLRYINTSSLKLNLNSGIYSQRNGSVVYYFNTFNSDILSAIITAGEIKPANTSIAYEISGNNGTNWTVVLNGEEKLLDVVGNNFSVRVNLSSINNTATPEVLNLLVEVISGQSKNITVDFGSDGVVEYTFNDELNATTSPLIVNITNNIYDFQAYSHKNCNGSLYCPLSWTISSVTGGKIQLETYSSHQGVHTISFNTSKLENCQTCSINYTFINGILQLDDARIDYLGSKNMTVNCSGTTNDIRVKYSKFNISKAYRYMEFFPNSVNATNVTPYAQTNTKPFWNITNLAYEVPLNFSLRLNKTLNSCVNMTASKDSAKGNGSILLNTSIQFIGNLSLQNSSGIWFWVDLYNCNSSAFRYFNPRLCIYTICNNCVQTFDYNIGSC